MIIRAVIAACDGCGAEQDTGGDRGRFDDAHAALWAAEMARWVRRMSGRLLCPTCADVQRCKSFGHRFEPDAWRLCACDRSIPAHDGNEPWQDPTTWDGCGWAWRLCGRCDHIDERHVADTVQGRAAERAYYAALDRGEIPTPMHPEDQPGGHIRQDTPAGPALPSNHKDSEENAMVEPTSTLTRSGWGAR